MYVLPPRILNHHSQSTGSDVDACVWSVAEVCVGIVGACLPTLRPLFTRKERLRRDSSPKEVCRRYSYGAEKSWETQMKHAQSTITAVKPSRSRNSDERPFVETTITATKRPRPNNNDGPPLIETTITTVKSPRSQSGSGRPSLQLSIVPEAHMYW